MPSALAALPLSQILRTYLITSISSSPVLFGASTRLLRSMLDSKSALFDVDRNPILRTILLETFYKQFCAGSTEAEVRKMCSKLRQQGYSGVILEYALEVLKDAEGTDEAQDVEFWRVGTMGSVSMASPGDYVGLKWSGMGPAAMRRMKRNEAPSADMEKAMHEICKAAAEKNVVLLPSAEETWTLDGYFDWTMQMQRIYNTGGKGVVCNTYQAYLKQAPERLAKHLEVAKAEGFTLGVKVVRGAYLHSEERSLIHDSIEHTHEAYDSIASSLIHRDYNDFVRPASRTSGQWPQIGVVLATHNLRSVQRAQALRRTQASRGEPLTELMFAQLQGMADEVSATLVAAAKAPATDSNAVRERVYKCTSFGTMSQCLNYLLRRAAENKDAAGRTADTRKAMSRELRRRVGLA
ncbi:Proline dehydrogenase [Teratosphaeria destructans]|uniref:Proline dehydrogenase n=1 Tax=Teratosphaeria destructans TaxID=418781 RepID=A0A9W7W5B6_9PEZI|nr:Proline dehydrogenase [Teratosphaeria destructans]